MVSIQKQVSKVLQDNENITLSSMYEKFSHVASGTIKSAFYRAKKEAKDNANIASGSKITMENMESLLVKQLKKKPDIPTLRLMVDFLKIKQQDQSELKEIDLSIFYKKSLEEDNDGPEGIVDVPPLLNKEDQSLTPAE